MPLYLPAKMPTGLSDDYSLRWSVRSDGDSVLYFLIIIKPETEMPALRDIRCCGKDAKRYY